jgi:hypothetical protein
MFYYLLVRCHGSSQLVKKWFFFIILFCRHVVETVPIIVVVLDQYLWIKRKYIQSYQYKLCGIYCTVGYCCCNCVYNCRRIGSIFMDIRCDRMFTGKHPILPIEVVWNLLDGTVLSVLCIWSGARVAEASCCL